jgi:uncharacterized protein (DUF433 family)
VEAWHYWLATLQNRHETLKDYAAARGHHIVKDPEIMGGLPCIKGTRIPVYSVFGRVNDGEPIGKLLEDWPYLSEDDIAEAVDYAKKHPRKDGPKIFRKA